MVALSVHLLALTSAFVPGAVMQQPVEYYAYEPSTQFLGRADLVMNTKYGDPKVLAYKKKDPKTGSTKGLFGYTVGSRAPPRAKSSGTRVNPNFGYGIDNLYGGKKIVASAPKPGDEAKKNFGYAALAFAVLFLISSVGK
jgi:hypothetical protein